MENNFSERIDFALMISLFNTYLGLENYRKNTEQHEKQDRMEAKIDEVLSILKGENE